MLRVGTVGTFSAVFLRAVGVLGLVVTLLPANAATIEVRDDRGTTLRLQTPAKRIIALAPHLTEIAYAAGAGPALVAVSAYSDYPPEAQRLPRVGDGARVDIERILTLKPDLVLAWQSGNQAGDIARLEQLGIAVWVSEPSRLDDIARLLRGVALLAGVSAAGEGAASAMERDLNALRLRHATRAQGQTAVRVFYEIWHQPLMTVNGRHMINDAITLCGGRNVFADVVTVTPTVTLEAVLAAQPQVVIGGGSAHDAAALSTRWRAMPLPALRELPTYFVDPDIIQRASPRVLKGVQAVCGFLDNTRSANPISRP